MAGAIPWVELALALGPALVAVAFYELVFVLPLRRRTVEIDEEVAALQRSIEGAAGLTARIVGSERRVREQLNQVSQRLGQLELRSESRPYEQAIDLAARGGGADRLISYFGLTEGEASLVRLLHGRRLKKRRAPGPGSTAGGR